jgi:uncharacterized protein YqgV (UPF0045/DUF77 family)
MQITAELSLYPLSGDALLSVLDFIAHLKTAGLSIQVNQVSTQITGESGAVFAAIQDATEHSFAAGGKQALVVKFLSVALPIAVSPDLTPPR